MIYELFPLYIGCKCLCYFGRSWSRKLVNVYILEWLCPIDGDPGVLLDLLQSDSILGLLLHQLGDKVVQ